MLDLLKNIWNNDQSVKTKQLELNSLKRLKEEHAKEIQKKVLDNQDYKDLQEVIESKERSIMELLNALQILYDSKSTLEDSLLETLYTENPFEFQKELDELLVPRSFSGYTGTSGYTGPVGPVGMPSNNLATWMSSTAPTLNSNTWPNQPPNKKQK